MKKQFTSVALSLALILGGCGTAFESSSSTPSDGKISVAELIQTTANLSVTPQGTTISSDKPYEASLKGVLKGDSSLRFFFPELPQSYCAGAFNVHIRDALDPTVSFTVRYVLGVDHPRGDKSWTFDDPLYGNVRYSYTNVYVLYGDDAYSSKVYDYGKTYYKNYTDNGWEDANASPSLMQATAEKYRVSGTLSLVWEEDGLHIKVNCRGYAPRSIAVFDGTDEFVSGESWGLPTLDFENGYTLSFSSSFESDKTSKRATDVRLEELTYLDINTFSPQTLRFHSERIFRPSFMLNS